MPDGGAPAAPAEGASAEGAPTVGASAEGASAVSASAEGASAEGAPTVGASAEGASAVSASAEGASAEGASAEGASAVSASAVSASAPSASTASSVSTASSAPSAAELLAFARRIAANAELVASLPLDPEGRTWLRLEGPGGSEAWLIGWPPGTGTGWHDHGGSHGAFAAAAGELTEQSLAAQLPTEGWKTLELADGVDRHRRLPPGRGRAFGPHHVHQVFNASEDRHAVSVHAYYPPLPLMRRYSRTGPLLRLEQIERAEEWA